MPRARASSSVCRLVTTTRISRRPPSASRAATRRAAHIAVEPVPSPSFIPSRTKRSAACVPSAFFTSEKSDMPHLPFAKLPCYVYYEAGRSYSARAIHPFTDLLPRFSRSDPGRLVHSRLRANDRVLEQGGRRAHGIPLRNGRGTELPGQGPPGPPYGARRQPLQRRDEPPGPLHDERSRGDGASHHH